MARKTEAKCKVQRRECDALAVQAKTTAECEEHAPCARAISHRLAESGPKGFPAFNSSFFQLTQAAYNLQRISCMRNWRHWFAFYLQRHAPCDQAFKMSQSVLKTFVRKRKSCALDDAYLDQPSLTPLPSLQRLSQPDRSPLAPGSLVGSASVAAPSASPDASRGRTRSGNAVNASPSLLKRTRAGASPAAPCNGSSPSRGARAANAASSPAAKQPADRAPPTRRASNTDASTSAAAQTLGAKPGGSKGAAGEASAARGAANAGGRGDPYEASGGVRLRASIA